MASYNFSGVWKLRFWYPSNDHDGDDIADYTMEVYQRGAKLSMDSRPRVQGGHMTINLNVDGNLATGSWIESTMPDSDLQGLVYSGAMQLLIKNDGRVMDGEWVGAGREHLDNGTFETQMYHGRWLLERVDGDVDNENGEDEAKTLDKLAVKSEK